MVGGPHAPLAEAGLELAAEQEGDDPSTEQEQEFERLNGHRRWVSERQNEVVVRLSAGEVAPNIARAGC